MKREQFYILVYLLKQKSTSAGSALTAAEIQRGLVSSAGKEIKKTALYKHLHTCVENGWMDKGLSAGRAETYYITAAGNDEAGRSFRNCDNM